MWPWLHKEILFTQDESNLQSWRGGLLRIIERLGGVGLRNFFYSLFWAFTFLIAVPDALAGSKLTEIGKKAVGMHLEKGERFRLPGSKEVYRVKREIDAGEDRRVYAVVRLSDERQFVFKHARTKTIPKGREGIKKEINTVKRLNEMAVRHPAVETHGKDWLMRDWVNGPLGLVWFKRWKAGGYDPKDPLWQKFYELVERTAEEGLVVGAMDLDDIIEVEGDWSVIDSGRVREMSPEEAWEFYRDDLVYSWGTKLGNADVCEVLLRLVVPRSS